MAHAIEMFFDDKADDAVRKIWLAFHAQVHTSLANQPIQHCSYYLPGNWVPHCTLAQGLDSTGRATAIELLHNYQPIAATVTTMGITDTRTGEVTQLTP